MKIVQKIRRAKSVSNTKRNIPIKFEYYGGMRMSLNLAAMVAVFALDVGVSLSHFARGTITGLILSSCRNSLM